MQSKILSVWSADDNCASSQVLPPAQERPAGWNERERAGGKVWKPLSFSTESLAVVPASLHIHLSFLPVRCLFHLLPPCFFVDLKCKLAASSFHLSTATLTPTSVLTLPFSLPSMCLYKWLLLLPLKHKDTHRQSAICCLCASLCFSFFFLFGNWIISLAENSTSVFGGYFPTTQLEFTSVWMVLHFHFNINTVFPFTLVHTACQQIYFVWTPYQFISYGFGPETCFTPLFKVVITHKLHRF